MGARAPGDQSQQEVSVESGGQPAVSPLQPGKGNLLGSQRTPLRKAGLGTRIWSRLKVMMETRMALFQFAKQLPM